jgi:hypothetical protein
MCISGKSRLLLQLAYRVADEAIDPSASISSSIAGVSTAAASVPISSEMNGMMNVPPPSILGDPFQPVLLILPKSRSLEQISTNNTNTNTSGMSNKQKISPLIGLFGPRMRPEVLQKIKIKCMGYKSNNN